MFLYRFQKSTKKYLLSILTGIILYVIVLPHTLNQYHAKSDEYFIRINAGGELNTFEKSGILGLNIIIAIVAYPFYPEISTETLLMIFPDKDGIRHFKSDFFMESPKVQKAFKNNFKHIYWSSDEYLNLNESRVALALNPCDLKKEKIGNVTKYTATVM